MGVMLHDTPAQRRRRSPVWQAPDQPEVIPKRY